MIKNKNIGECIEVSPIIENMIKNRHKWFDK